MHAISTSLCRMPACLGFSPLSPPVHLSGAYCTQPDAIHLKASCHYCHCVVVAVNNYAAAAPALPPFCGLQADEACAAAVAAAAAACVASDRARAICSSDAVFFGP